MNLSNHGQLPSYGEGSYRTPDMGGSPRHQSFQGQLPPGPVYGPPGVSNSNHPNSFQAPLPAAPRYFPGMHGRPPSHSLQEQLPRNLHYTGSGGISSGYPPQSFQAQLPQVQQQMARFSSHHHHQHFPTKLAQAQASHHMRALSNGRRTPSLPVSLPQGPYYMPAMGRGRPLQSPHPHMPQAPAHNLAMLGGGPYYPQSMGSTYIDEDDIPPLRHGGRYVGGEGPPQRVAQGYLVNFCDGLPPKLIRARFPSDADPSAYQGGIFSPGQDKDWGGNTMNPHPMHGQDSFRGASAPQHTQYYPALLGGGPLDPPFPEFSHFPTIQPAAPFQQLGESCAAASPYNPQVTLHQPGSMEPQGSAEQHYSSTSGNAQPYTGNDWNGALQGPVTGQNTTAPSAHNNLQTPTTDQDCQDGGDSFFIDSWEDIMAMWQDPEVLNAGQTLVAMKSAKSMENISGGLGCGD